MRTSGAHPGGGRTWPLLELPFHGWPFSLPETLYGPRVRGFRAVLAHPERAGSVQFSPDRLRDVVGRGRSSGISPRG